MFEFIRSIPGPYFLLIYAAFVFLVLIISKYILENDYTAKLQVPEPTTIDPLEISLLKNGIKGTIALSVYNLWRNQKIEFERSKGSLFIQNLVNNGTGSNKLETAILKNNPGKMNYGFLFTNKSLKTAKKILTNNFNSLIQKELLANKNIKTRYFKISVVVFLILFIPGILKLFMGISRHKSVGFLILELVIAAVAFFRYLKPLNVNYTNLGKNLLKQTSNRFEWMNKEVNNNSLTDNNLLYFAAIFGIGSLMNTSYAELIELPMNDGLFKTWYNSSTSGSGCGGSGCGGGSCGGGGCGGGGCGGCGGN